MPTVPARIITIPRDADHLHDRIAIAPYPVQDTMDVSISAVMFGNEVSPLATQKEEPSPVFMGMEHYPPGAQQTSVNGP